MTAAYGLVGTYFGPSIYGQVSGIRSVFVALGGVVGPIMGGWIFDLTGSYANAFWIIVVCLVISVLMLCFASPPKVKLGETAAKTL
jgi:nitrate/nitrite transporter NarK